MKVFWNSYLKSTEVLSKCKIIFIIDNLDIRNFQGVILSKEVLLCFNHTIKD
jgi:hypothetical protein